eukprot:7668615-Pyramimonas_sp.AAC.1
MAKRGKNEEGEDEFHSQPRAAGEALTLKTSLGLTSRQATSARRADVAPGDVHGLPSVHDSG